MLNVRRTHKIRTAGLLAAIYALAVLLPSLAFSFDRDVSIVHSLTEVHGGLLIPHFHHDDADHEGSDHSTPGGTHHCCGSLSLPGLLSPAEVAIAAPICSSLISPVPDEPHAGCGPVRLDRPPRLPSLI